MKASIIITILIFINTSALISEPVFNLLKGINSWWLIITEVLLVIGYYVNNVLKGLNVISKVDLSNLKLYTFSTKSHYNKGNEN